MSRTQAAWLAYTAGMHMTSGTWMVRLAMLACLGAAGACASKTVISQPDATTASTIPITSPASSVATTISAAPSTTIGASSTTPAPATTSTLPAAVGSTVTLEGTKNKLAISVTNFLDPVAATGFSKPDDGKHFVGVQIRVLNAGTNAWSDSLANGAKLVDDKRQEYRTTFASGTGLPDFRATTVGAGDTRLGWVLFEVPDATSIERFTLALDSGFANQIGQWLVGAGAPADPAPAVTAPETGVGSSITLPGAKVKMAVTVKDVKDNVAPTNPQTSGLFTIS